MKYYIFIITIFFFNNLAVAQEISQDKMNNNIYYYNKPQSKQAKLIQKTMKILKMDKKMEKNIIKNTFNKKAAKIPKSIAKKFDIKTLEQNNRKIWEITKKDNEPDIIILYLHGGAYYGNLKVQHWPLIEQILQTTNSKIIVPDYPLAPEANCLEVYSFMTTLYTRIITEYPNKRIILMGDSAGGGIALGFAQKNKNDKVKQPDEIILFSPWLDVSMSNPDIINFEKNDNMLSTNGLKHAGIKYAGNLDQTDYRVSPIYGDFKGLGKISIFTGTNDILIADARKCKLLLEKQNISFNYFEYQDMFHDWVVITSLIESQDVINKIGNIIN